MFKTLVLLFTYFVSIQSIIVNQILCDRKFEKNINNGVFMKNNSIEFEGVVYDEENYFFYNYTEKTSTKLEEYVGCPCNFNKCFRKCCPIGEALNENYSCTSLNTIKELDLYIYENEDHKTSLTLQDFVPIYGSDCDTGQVVTIDPTEKGSFYLQKNGSLSYDIENYKNTSLLGHHCIDLINTKYEDQFQAIALVCTSTEIEDNSDVTKTYAGLMVIALPFIFGTFLIYILIPELRKTTHGKCIACYSISYFIGSSLLSIKYFFDTILPQKICVGTAFICYSCFMASFFWLNVMSIDVWWTFSGRRGFKKNEYNQRKKMIIYSCYAWGSAALALSISLIFQYMNTKLIPSFVVRPEIGVIKCWFGNTTIQGYYMYGPILTIMAVNCILFIWTGINIYKIKRETQKTMQQTGDSQKHVNKSTGEFKFYLKLFLAFGINWCFEVIPWLTGKTYEWQKFLDLVNLLYGIFIFILSCCNKKVYNLLRKRMTTFIQSISSTTSTTSTNSQPKISNIGLNDIAQNDI